MLLIFGNVFKDTLNYLIWVKLYTRLTFESDKTNNVWCAFCANLTHTYV